MAQEAKKTKTDNENIENRESLDKNEIDIYRQAMLIYREAIKFI